MIDIVNLPKLWILPLAWTWNITLLGLTFDIGCALIYRFMNKNNPYKTQIFNFIKQIALFNLIWLCISILIFFTIFGPAFSGLSMLFSPIITLLMFALAIRTLAIKFYDVHFFGNKSNYAYLNSSTKKFTNWIITDTSIVILCIFSAIFGTILNGIPFYLNNSKQLISLFRIEDCLNPTSLLIFLLLIIFSITQASVFCYIKTQLHKMKIIALISTILLFTIISCSIFPIENLIEEFHYTYFSKNIIRSVFITLPISALILIAAIINKRYTLALITSSGIIKIFMIIFDLILFPFIVPSSIDTSQSLICINSFSNIQTLVVSLIFVIPMLIAALCTVWIYNKLINSKTLATSAKTKNSVITKL